jgi:hypothetical protein
MGGIERVKRAILTIRQRGVTTFTRELSLGRFVLHEAAQGVLRSKTAGSYGRPSKLPGE